MLDKERWSIAMIVVCALLVGTLSGCRTRKTTIFVDNWWNRDYAKNACEAYQERYNVGCFKTPDEIATELKLRFASSILQAPACKDVTISYEPLNEKNLKAYEDGWDLSFNIGVDGGDVDYSNSIWQIIDGRTKKRFAEGPLKDPVEAATRVCTVVTGQGGSVSQ